MDHDVISRCKEFLGKRDLRLPEQDRACKLTVVVPAYDEAPETIERQIASAEEQTGLADGEVELLYVINNDRRDQAESTAVKANDVVLGLLGQRQVDNADVRMAVVDASSAGQEIAGCNVGKARNLGLHIAALRFAGRSYNGPIMHTDADTFFSDLKLFRNIIDTFEADPKLIGATGGRTFVIPTRNNPDWDHVEPVFEQMLFAVKCIAMLAFLDGTMSEMTFRDANFVGRAYESVLSGGIPEIDLGEDGQFGLQLVDYAKHHDGRVRSFKHDWMVTSLLRLSARTKNNFRPTADKLRAGEILTQKHPVTGDEVRLTADSYGRLRAEVAALKGGLSFISYFERIADVKIVPEL